MNELVTGLAYRDVPGARLDHLSRTKCRGLRKAMMAFLDTAGTATARATFYNTREEQEQAAEALHAALFTVDRGVYTAALFLPGVTDYARQIGVARLLGHTRDGKALLSADEERTAIDRLCAGLPPQRQLKLFGRLAEGHVNNARTRKLILRSILGSRRLQWWAVKYRRKLARALRHAWGERTTGILRRILAKPPDARNAREKGLVARHVDRFVTDTGRLDRVRECAGFVLGIEQGLTLPSLRAYCDAKDDILDGATLPYETLEGIRSRFHPEVDSNDLLDLVKDRLSTGQRLGLQRKAREAGIEIEFDPAKHDPVRLYIYAFEMGMTDAIREALVEKARSAAARYRMQFERLVLIVDASASMLGHRTQRRRPIAVALTLRDLLAAGSRSVTIRTADGRDAPMGELVEAQGETALGPAIVAALRDEPDAVIVLSDGYENAPAGRSAEVIHVARGLGVDTPIVQVSPVFAAEAAGLREISELVPAMPMSSPEGIALAMLKSTFQQDLELGVGALLMLAGGALGLPQDRTPQIGGQSDGSLAN